MVQKTLGGSLVNGIFWGGRIRGVFGWWGGLAKESAGFVEVKRCPARTSRRCWFDGREEGRMWFPLNSGPVQ
jgi:hypothetical protein